MPAERSMNAFKISIARRGDVAGYILLAGGGSWFLTRKIVIALNRHGIAESMGRVVAGGDSAAMESLWSLLQTNIHN